MKYSEFKREVEDMGFIYKEEQREIWVTELYGNIVLTIGKNVRFNVDTAYEPFDGLSENFREKLFDLSIRLSRTPLEDREYEKKYRLKLNAPVLNGQTVKVYLNYSYDLNKYIMACAASTDRIKTIFTESELKEIDETGFIREEVTE